MRNNLKDGYIVLAVTQGGSLYISGNCESFKTEESAKDWIQQNFLNDSAAIIAKIVDHGNVKNVIDWNKKS